MQLRRYNRPEERTLDSDENLETEIELLVLRSQGPGRSRITEEEAGHLRALRRIREALGRFDLSKNEVRVYLFLARFGAQKAQRIAEALSVHRTEAYKILRRLEKQGLVMCVFERPMKFVSVPFEEALGSLIEERRQQIHRMERWKKELTETWKSLPKSEDRKTKKETFQVLEGRKQVSVKATQLLDGCCSELLMVLSDENLLWLYNSPFFDNLERKAAKRGIDVRLMTGYSSTSSYVLDEISLGEGNFAYKDLREAPCFIVSDGEEMLLMMERAQEGKPFAMWTNYGTLVKSFKLLFNVIWKDPTDTVLMAGAPQLT